MNRNKCILITIGVMTCQSVLSILYFTYYGIDVDKKGSSTYNHAMNFNYMDNLIKTAHLPYRAYLLKILDIKPDYKILDIGCGHGIFTNQYAQMLNEKKGGEVVCIEGSKMMKNMAETAALKLGVENTTQYILNRVNIQEPIPFKNNYFDISYSNRVLHNTDNPAYILQDMIRVTKPGGKIIVIGEDVETIRVFHLGSVANYFTNKIIPYVSSSIAKSYKFITNIKAIYQDYKLTNIQKKTIPIVSTEPYPNDSIKDIIYHIPYLPQFIKTTMLNYYSENSDKAVLEGDYYDMVNMIICSGIKPELDL